jgi:ribosomal protein S18 acetylase RimI-like enzyme
VATIPKSSSGDASVDRARMALDAGFTVRPPVLSDINELARVQVSVWQEAYAGMVSQAYLDSLTLESSRDLWRQLLSDASPRPASRFVAISPGGALVGIAASGVSRSALVVQSEELYDLAVVAEQRGSGVADLLMRSAIADRPAELWVIEENARARAFYQRHRFRPHGDALTVDELGITEIRLTRQ